MDKGSVINEIKSFLDGGNDDLKYLVNVETNPETNKAICVIHEPNTDHRIEEIPYTPFLYVKDFKKLGYHLYNSDKEYTIAKMKKHGVTIKKMNTGNHPRLENGYPYKVTSTRSYNHIMEFFKEGGMNPFETVKDEDGRVVRDVQDRVVYKYRDLFYMPKLNEQFFISTGARLFKGIEEYKDLHRLTFDIETTGLRYEHTRIFSIGVRDNRGFEITLEVEEDDNDGAEIKLIQDFFNLISLIKPAVIVGYNSEEFDFPFILGRADILGMELKGLTTTLSDNNMIRKQSASVKFGNTTEKYKATVMWGYTVLDILHAVKRTVAVNTDIKNARLKYICQYEGIAKPNRMYIEGDKIGSFWKEQKIFLINPDNNHYVKIPDQFQKSGQNLLLIQEKKDDIGQAKYDLLKRKILDEEPNFVTWLRETTPQLLKDGTGLKFIDGKDILRRYLLDDLWETEQVDNLYNQSSFLLAKIVPTTYGRIATMGNAAVWNLLMTTWSYENDLAIPHPDEIERFSGGLTRCYKKGWTKRVAKIDFASLYPMLQLWLDIFPMFDITGVIKKMLMYMTTTRNIYKKLAASVDLEPDEVELMKEIDHDTYEKYINNSFTKAERKMYKTKQLPIKILNNSLFGALGSGFAFNWSDNICAARITCSGRLSLRQAISWFKDFGLEPLLAVTDGVNFGIPDTTTIRITDSETLYDQPEGTIEEMWQFAGEVGLGAIIEKFNHEEMKSEFMSVDNDGEFKSCLNLSRINYALLTDKDKIKLTGNTIKSKTMPEYIEEFVDNGIRMILEGRGQEFVNYYHDYAEKIFYKQIPLKKIASKSKVKNTLKDYINRGTDKNGKPKARQAHMELLLKQREEEAKSIFYDRFDEFNGDKDKAFDQYTIEEIMKLVESYMSPEPPLDSMVYYVNNGTRKSHGDVKTKKVTNKETGEEASVIEINANLIPQKDLENNPELTGEYNVDKYLDAFNKRVEVLLDGFDEEVRDRILVKIKRKKVKKVEQVELLKNQFTSTELQLKNFDHDEYEPSMYLEDKELEFWNRTGYDPEFIWDGFSRHEDDLELDVYQHALDFLSDKMTQSGKPRVKSVNEELDKGDYVLIKNFDNYDLGYNNGEFIEILRTGVEIPKSPRELAAEQKLIEEENNLRKLQVDDDDALNPELREKVDVEEKKRIFFMEFKEQHNLDLGLDMQTLFDAVPNSQIAFNDFVISKLAVMDVPDESPELEYFDGGDY